MRGTRFNLCTIVGYYLSQGVVSYLTEFMSNPQKRYFGRLQVTHIYRVLVDATLKSCPILAGFREQTSRCQTFGAGIVRHRPDDRPPLECAKHYRSRAAELRTIAEEWMDSGVRESLMRVAKDYEHMAQRLEKQAKFLGQAI